MFLQSSGNATQLLAGLALYLDKELRLRGPDFRRKSLSINHLEYKDQYYWLLRSIANQLFTTCRDAEFVFGIAVVRDCGINLHTFINNFEQARNIDRNDALACYNFYASKAFDEDMGDIWIFKGTHEHAKYKETL